MIQNSDLAAAVEPLFEAYTKREAAIELVSLATSDGFSVLVMNNGSKPVESDKLAAAASTLHSVSGAVSRQILGKSFDVSFIETGAGNIALVSLSLSGRDFVLMMSAGEAMNIASLRMFIKRLAVEISKLSFK